MQIGQPTYFFESLDSTNIYAASLIANKKPVAGTVIDTAHQTHGHGQKDRRWWSPAGVNITLSVILRPEWLAIERQFLLNVMTSLAITQTIQEYTTKKVEVKWPNDVYVEGEKISGILIQNGIQGKKIQYSIVGIGLNVNQRIWPDDVQNPTSLNLASKAKIDLTQVKQKLFFNLEIEYQIIKSEPDTAIERYVDLLYKKDISTVFYLGNEEVRGVIKTIDAFGRLIIETNQGNRTFNLGEISFSKPI
ncbi:MAG: BirA family biotin operon repressor/biotin-[acetyl-CoA-carboxylase] ligase [Saprospiraceae bacterium]|jgi:BirA family biotin operon repressor/biotin-[acetyl-CoA-carboxylase] ligase